MYASFPDHQVIYIEHVTNEGTRHVTRDMAADIKSSFKFRAFDEDLHVDVTEESADMFVDQTASCNVINAKGLVERTEVIPTSCFYHGNVRGHKDSVVTMSTCNGLVSVRFLIFQIGVDVMNKYYTLLHNSLTL